MNDSVTLNSIQEALIKSYNSISNSRRRFFLRRILLFSIKFLRRKNSTWVGMRINSLIT